MIIRPHTIGVLLLAGAAVSVVVAWGSAVWAPHPLFVPGSRPAFEDPGPILGNWPADSIHGVQSTWALTWIRSSHRAIGPPRESWCENAGSYVETEQLSLQAGVPFRCLQLGQDRVFTVLTGADQPHYSEAPFMPGRPVAWRHGLEIPE